MEKWKKELERRLNFKGVNGYSLEDIVDNISHLNGKSPSDAKRYFTELVKEAASPVRQDAIREVIDSIPDKGTVEIPSGEYSAMIRDIASVKEDLKAKFL